MNSKRKTTERSKPQGLSPKTETLLGKLVSSNACYLAEPLALLQ